MGKDKIESIINGGDAYKVVQQGDWSIDVFKRTYDNHIVQCSESLKFYRLEGYTLKAHSWPLVSSDAYLVEVTPVEETVVHWREVG